MEQNRMLSLYLALLLFGSVRGAVQPSEYRLNDDDPIEYSWRNRGFEARILEYLREMREGTGGSGGFELVPPPRHRPHRPFTYTLEYPAQRPQPFAVPPSDARFYQNAQLIGSDEDNLMSGSENMDFVLTKRPPDEHLLSSTESVSSSVPSTEVGDNSSTVFKTPLIDFNASKEAILFVVVAGTSAAVLVALLMLGYGYYRLHKSSKAAADVDYPAYGVTGPNKESTPTGDRRLAHSAQMYHYQLTKQQIIAMESNRGSGERRGSVSEADSDEENEEGDYTVYECPGLAPTGEMEVKNPLFQDEATPAVDKGEDTAK